jgi:hypothetical protein
MIQYYNYGNIQQLNNILLYVEQVLLVDCVATAVAVRIGVRHVSPVA